MQIFYDRAPTTHKRDIDYSAGGRFLHKSPNDAWEIIESLAQYEEEEGWYNYYDEEEALNPENPNLKQLLKAMEWKVESLMANVLPPKEEDHGVFMMTRKEAYSNLPKPTRQEEFDHITTRFDIDQNERIEQLET